MECPLRLTLASEVRMLLGSVKVSMMPSLLVSLA